MERCLYKPKKGLIKHIQHLPMFFSEKYTYMCAEEHKESPEGPHNKILTLFLCNRIISNSSISDLTVYPKQL